MKQNCNEMHFASSFVGRIVAVLLFAFAQGTWAQNPSIKFIERSWEDQGLVEEARYVDSYTVLEGNPGEWMQMSDDKYYVVKDNVEYKTLNVLGKAHLILCDGATLTCTGGIKVEADKNNKSELFIYSQSDGDNQGKLIVTNSYDDAAGIGCAKSLKCGEITIHGGKLDIHGGKYGAGIGAGGSVSYVTPELWSYTSGATDGKTIIYGGDITAQGGYQAAGIGGGDYGNGGSFYLYGGKVTAKGGEYAAGVGGGMNGHGSYVNICGGTLNAYGGVDAAGIGGGEDGRGGETHISGGTVRAEGRSYGAGIGGGEDGYGGDTYITGGTVVAIAGKDCKGRDANCGSAIGCGDDVSNKDSESKAKKLVIDDLMKVTGGDSETDIERVFTSAERVAACLWRNYVRIEACPHTTPTEGSDHTEPFTYSFDDLEKHTRFCRYCNWNVTEDHEMSNCPCGVDKDGDVIAFTMYEPSSEEGGSGYVAYKTYRVSMGNEFYLPMCSKKWLDDDYVFLGWEMNPNPEDPTTNNWAAYLSGDPSGDDKIPAGKSIQLIEGMENNATFYARYLYLFDKDWKWADDCSNVTLTLSHPDLDDVVLSSADGQVVLTSGKLINEDQYEFGLTYFATVTYKVNGYEYNYDSKNFKLHVLELLDDADNSEEIERLEGKIAVPILENRTLYGDGAWNTICVPFDMDKFDLEYYEINYIMELKSSNYNSNTKSLDLNFEPADKIKAGVPYLIAIGDYKYDDINSNPDYEKKDQISPNFEPAVIDNSLHPTETEYVNFVGSFSPVPLTGNDKSVLYLGAENTLYYPAENMDIGSCRAYFELKGLTAGELADLAPIRLNFGEEETGIEEVHGYGLEDHGYGPGWYTLDGLRIDGKPTQKGVYISSGRKMIIK